MGLLYDLITGRKKKRCAECGCLMVPDVEADFCEQCILEFYDK